jgi:tetratricopeptide (TPR) repeat protein
MRKGFIAVFILGLAAALPAAPAAAQDADQEFTCEAWPRDAKAAIAACAALINAGRLAGPDLAKVFARRCGARFALKAYGRALADCDKAIALDATDASAFTQRGMAYAAVGRLDEAIADFDEALRLDPRDDYDAEEERTRAIVRRDTARALAAAPDRPGNADALVRRGYAHYEDARHELAIPLLSRVIRLRPDDAVALLVRGVSYGRVGLHQEAVDDLGRVLRREPGNPHALYWRADSYRLMGDAERAIADWTEMLRLQPDQFDIIQDRADAYRDIHRYDLEIEDRGSLIRLASGNPEHVVGRGDAYVRHGDYARAIADYDEALRLDPNAKNAPDHRCLARAMSAPPAEAGAECAAAPDGAWTLAGRGLVNLRMGKPEAALRHFDDALPASRPPAEILYGRGLAKRMTGDAAGADEDFAWAEKLEPRIAAKFASFAVPKP